MRDLQWSVLHGKPAAPKTLKFPYRKAFQTQGSAQVSWHRFGHLWWAKAFTSELVHTSLVSCSHLIMAWGSLQPQHLIRPSPSPRSEPLRAVIPFLPTPGDAAEPDLPPMGSFYKHLFTTPCCTMPVPHQPGFHHRDLSSSSCSPPV